MPMTRRKTAGLVTLVLIVIGLLWWVQSKLSGIFGQM